MMRRKNATERKMEADEEYFKKDYKQGGFVRLPLEVRWKALILAMRGGEWVTIGYVQEVTGFKRKRVKNLMKRGMAAGIIEKAFQDSWEEPPKITRRGWEAVQKNPSGWLMREQAFYRLRMDKIEITIE